LEEKIRLSLPKEWGQQKKFNAYTREGRKKFFGKNKGAFFHEKFYFSSGQILTGGKTVSETFLFDFHRGKVWFL